MTEPCCLHCIRITRKPGDGSRETQNTKSGAKENIGLVELTFCLACDGVVLQFDGAPILVLLPDLLEWIPGAACALWQKLLGPFYWNGYLKKPLLVLVGFALQQQRGMSLRFEADEVALLWTCHARSLLIMLQATPAISS